MVSMVYFSSIENKYWRRGISYKFTLLDRPKIRSFGIFGIIFFGISKLGQNYNIRKRTH